MKCLYGIIGVTFVYDFVLRKCDLKGPYSATSKNRGWAKKNEGWIAVKSGGGSLTVSSYLQRGSVPSGQWFSLACFLISRPSLNNYRHTFTSN